MIERLGGHPRIAGALAFALLGLAITLVAHRDASRLASGLRASSRRQQVQMIRKLREGCERTAIARVLEVNDLRGDVRNLRGDIAELRAGVTANRVIALDSTQSEITRRARDVQVSAGIAAIGRKQVSITLKLRAIAVADGQVDRGRWPQLDAPSDREAVRDGQILRLYRGQLYLPGSGPGRLIFRTPFRCEIAYPLPH